MAEVFISYKAEDRRRVQPLVAALEADGLSVWWDARIGGGDEWRRAIEQHLDAAGCVLVIWSKRSIAPEGRFVRDEAARAQRRGTYLPVRIDKVEPPLGFGESQALPLTGWKGDRTDTRYQSVVGAARAMMSGEPHLGHSVHQEERRVGRRTVIAGGAATAVAAGVGGWLLFKPESASASDSIAVLPFANLSGDPAQNYFSDGIAEELRSALSRLAGLKVVGRTSSEAVRNEDAETAARKLDVANILTGSVRQSPSTIRVNAQLVDGRNGIERWSQQYDRAPGDSIKIQTDIAASVAHALSIALGGAGEAALTAGGTQNPDAQRLLLRAAEGAREADTGMAFKQALALIDQAIAVDPEYADAYALKARLVNTYAGNFASGAAELSSLRELTYRMARKALGIAPDLPRAHLALAEYYQGTLNIAPAGVEFRRAVALAPGDPHSIRGYSGFLTVVGNARRSIQLAGRVVALDPLNPRSHANRLQVLFAARRHPEVVRSGRELQRNSPELLDSPGIVGNSLVILGRHEEAQQFYRLRPADDWTRLTGEAFLSARTGDRAGAQRRLMRMRELFGDAASYQYGEIHAQLGEADRVFAALDRAWEIKDPGLTSVRVDPWLDPVRNDRRLAQLIKRMNFPPASAIAAA